jgi:membrane protease YdiL (CAAX protease family)
MGPEISPDPALSAPQTEGQPAAEPVNPYSGQGGPLALTREGVERPYSRLTWIFIGDQGLRAGWSLAIFACLLFVFGNGIRFALNWAHFKLPSRSNTLTPRVAFLSELLQFVLLLLAAWVVSLIERRKLMDYNLRGPRPLARFGSGLITGFLALSVLIAAMSAGGWMHFGPVALSGSQILIYAVKWGVIFLMVGCFEEGLARCYLLFTLTRGLNFWWGLGLATGICVLVSLNPKASGLWGVYAIALLGLIPCLLLYLRKSPNEGFWNAAWVTSVLFGGGHTGNNGENWVGIFAAAGIGLVFCASVRLTGSAWWAIGCHAAWDWGESYFYGTPDSGLVASGHLLTTTQAGGVLWTGGADGPEGSLLVIPIILLLLLVLVLQYRRRHEAGVPAATEQPAAG